MRAEGEGGREEGGAGRARGGRVGEVIGCEIAGKRG